MKKALSIALAILLNATLVWGLQAPHDAHNAVGCSSCHMFRNPIGPHGTRASTNYDLCIQCHVDEAGMSLPILPTYKNYTVGLSGAFHKWNVYTSNSTYGASAPTNGVMSRRIENGKIVCSVCHDQHANNPSLRRMGRLRKSPVEMKEPGGAGTISYTVVNGAAPRAWIVKIVTAGTETTATYEVSFDAGRRWYGWSDPDWVIGAPPRLASTTPTAIHNDGSVLITFSGTDFQVDQSWQFYYAYPFLRTALDSGDNENGRRFCRDCHEQRAQTHYRAGNAWDDTMKSHPVGVSLNANGGGYDRKPLDVDGVQQGISSDTNTTNDLLLFGGYTAMLTTFGNLSSGDVQCMTCHAPHWTDSNSQTVDLR